MGVEAVVYDIGRVLLHWDPEGFYDRVIGPERRRQLFTEVDLHGMNEAVDLGADFRASVYDLAERHPDWRDEVRFWHDRWIEMASPGIELSAHLLRRLRNRGVPVLALSNFGIGSFEVAQRHYPVLTEFDRAFISGHLGVIKPDPEIYRILEAQTGIDPAGLLFADDKPENIAAASARGWKTHLFETPEAWAGRLVDEGLLSREDAAG